MRGKGKKRNRMFFLDYTEFWIIPELVPITKQAENTPRD